ncbi:hypothetical protein C8J57DRAFT_1674770 [Mycena rebaudengoi]|nr:hypothetical protein C8J57DRAFT_1674770 [Mycena rebaudengoi]
MVQLADIDAQGNYARCMDKLCLVKINESEDTTIVNENIIGPDIVMMNAKGMQGHECLDQLLSTERIMRRIAIFGFSRVCSLLVARGPFDALNRSPSVTHNHSSLVSVGNKTPESGYLEFMRSFQYGSFMKCHFGIFKNLNDIASVWSLGERKDNFYTFLPREMNTLPDDAEKGWTVVEENIYSIGPPQIVPEIRQVNSGRRQIQRRGISEYIIFYLFFSSLILTASSSNAALLRRRPPTSFVVPSPPVLPPILTPPLLPAPYAAKTDAHDMVSEEERQEPNDPKSLPLKRRSRGRAAYSFYACGDYPADPAFPAPTRRAYAVHARLLSWFLNNPAAPFGVHRMALASKAQGKDVCMWFGPARRRDLLGGFFVPSSFTLSPLSRPSSLPPTLPFLSFTTTVITSISLLHLFTVAFIFRSLPIYLSFPTLRVLLVFSSCIPCANTFPQNARRRLPRLRHSRPVLPARTASPPMTEDELVLNAQRAEDAAQEDLPRTIFAIQDEPPTWPGADDDHMGLESVSERRRSWTRTTGRGACPSSTRGLVVRARTRSEEEADTEEDPIAPITPLPTTTRFDLSGGPKAQDGAGRAVSVFPEEDGFVDVDAGREHQENPPFPIGPNLPQLSPI